MVGWIAATAATVAVVAVLLLVLSAVHLLPQLRNPFHTTTTVRSQPPLLKSITSLSRYEAASGTFQVVVDLSRHTSFLPSFIAGSQTLFVGDGSVIAFVDFGALKGGAIKVSRGRAVTIVLPKAQLEPAVLNVNQSYVFAEQQGLVNKVADFFSGNPNSQQDVYVLAQQKIQYAARSSPLLADAQRNTTAMLDNAGLARLQARHGRLRRLLTCVGNRCLAGEPDQEVVAAYHHDDGGRVPGHELCGARHGQRRQRAAVAGAQLADLAGGTEHEQAVLVPAMS